MIIENTSNYKLIIYNVYDILKPRRAEHAMVTDASAIPSDLSE